MTKKPYPLQMPAELHKAVKVEAAKTGKTMSDIINEATAKALGLEQEKGGGEHERRVVG